MKRASLTPRSGVRSSTRSEATSQADAVAEPEGQSSPGAAPRSKSVPPTKGIKLSSTKDDASTPKPRGRGRQPLKRPNTTSPSERKPDIKHRKLSPRSAGITPKTSPKLYKQKGKREISKLFTTEGFWASGASPQKRDRAASKTATPDASPAPSASSSKKSLTARNNSPANLKTKAAESELTNSGAIPELRRLRTTENFWSPGFSLKEGYLSSRDASPSSTSSSLDRSSRSRSAVGKKASEESVIAAVKTNHTSANSVKLLKQEGDVTEVCPSGEQSLHADGSSDVVSERSVGRPSKKRGRPATRPIGIRRPHGKRRGRPPLNKASLVPISIKKKLILSKTPSMSEHSSSTLLTDSLTADADTCEESERTPGFVTGVKKCKKRKDVRGKLNKSAMGKVNDGAKTKTLRTRLKQEEKSEGGSMVEPGEASKIPDNHSTQILEKVAGVSSSDQKIPVKGELKRLGTTPGFWSPTPDINDVLTSTTRKPRIIPSKNHSKGSSPKKQESSLLQHRKKKLIALQKQRQIKHHAIKELFEVDLTASSLPQEESAGLHKKQHLVYGRRKKKYKKRQGYKQQALLETKDAKHVDLVSKMEGDIVDGEPKLDHAQEQPERSAMSLFAELSSGHDIPKDVLDSHQRASSINLSVHETKQSVGELIQTTPVALPMDKILQPETESSIEKYSTHLGNGHIESDTAALSCETLIQDANKVIINDPVQQNLKEKVKSDSNSLQQGTLDNNGLVEDKGISDSLTKTLNIPELPTLTHSEVTPCSKKETYSTNVCEKIDSEGEKVILEQGVFTTDTTNKIELSNISHDTQETVEAEVSSILTSTGEQGRKEKDIGEIQSEEIKTSLEESSTNTDKEMCLGDDKTLMCQSEEMVDKDKPLCSKEEESDPLKAPTDSSGDAKEIVTDAASEETSKSVSDGTPPTDSSTCENAELIPAASHGDSNTGRAVSLESADSGVKVGDELIKPADDGSTSLLKSSVSDEVLAVSEAPPVDAVTNIVEADVALKKKKYKRRGSKHLFHRRKNIVKNPSYVGTTSILDASGTSNEIVGGDQTCAIMETDAQNVSVPKVLKKAGKRRKRAWQKGILHRAAQMYRKVGTAASSKPSTDVTSPGDIPVGDSSTTVPFSVITAEAQAMMDSVRAAKKSAKEKRVGILRRLQTDANLASGILEESSNQTRRLRDVALKNQSASSLKTKLAADSNVKDASSRFKAKPSASSKLKKKGPGRIGRPPKVKVRDELPELTPAFVPSTGRRFRTPPRLSPEPPLSTIAAESVDESDMHLYLSGVSDEETSPVKDGSGSDFSFVHQPVNLSESFGASQAEIGKVIEQSKVINQPQSLKQLSQAVIRANKPKTGVKMIGKKGKPPGMPMSDEDKLKLRASLMSRYDDYANFRMPRQTVAPLSLTPSSLNTAAKFSLRKKTTRSPLEMLEMKRRQEEAIYDLEEEKRLARRISRLEKQFPQTSTDDLSYSEYFDDVKDCSVILDDFVKKLDLEGVDMPPTDMDELSETEAMSDGPQFDDDAEDEDWCANLEDDGQWVDSRPSIPKLKIKRVMKPFKEKKNKSSKGHKSKKKSKSINPEQKAHEPLKLVIKTEMRNEGVEQQSKASSGFDVSKVQRHGFEGSFVDFLQGKSPENFMSYGRPGKPVGNTNKQDSNLLIMNLGDARSKSATPSTSLTSLSSDDRGAMLSSYGDKEGENIAALKNANIPTSNKNINLESNNNSLPLTKTISQTDSSNLAHENEGSKSNHQLMALSTCPDGWKTKQVQLGTDGKTQSNDAKLYTCIRCNFSTSALLTIESHIYSHIPGVQFRCGHCESEFSSMVATASHMRNTHLLKGDACLFISRHVEERGFYSVADHVTDSASCAGKESSNKTAEKDITKAASASPRALGASATQMQGMESNSPSNQSPSMDISEEPAAKVSQQGSSPTSRRRYVCTHCGFSTGVREDAEHHVSDLHPDSSVFACTLCKENTYYTQAEIREHAAVVHPTRVRPFRQIPDFYDAEKLGASSSTPENTTGLLERQGDNGVDHRQKAKDYLLLQEVLKEKRSAEADSTTAVDYPGDVNDETEGTRSLEQQHKSAVGESEDVDISSSAATSSADNSDLTKGAAQKISSAEVEDSSSMKTVEDSASHDDDCGLKIVQVVSLSEGPDLQKSALSPDVQKATAVSTSSTEPTSSLSSSPQPSNTVSTATSSVSQPSTTTSASSSQGQQQQHLQPGGGLPLSYKCSACKVHTPYLLMMVKHLKAKHPHMACFSCPYCKVSNSSKQPEISFASQKQLRNHIRKHHPDKTSRNEIALSSKAKQFVEAMVLPAAPECTRVGNRLVLEEDIYTCTYCGVKMTSLASVYEHLNDVHADLFEFVCPLCQKFKSKNLDDISQHSMSAHSSEVETDKVHVSVPKNLFSVLTCISKVGKYIEKQLNGGTAGASGDGKGEKANSSETSAAESTAPTPVAPLDLTSDTSPVPPPAHSGITSPPTRVSSVDLSTRPSPGVSLSSSLFDTSSLTAPPKSSKLHPFPGSLAAIAPAAASSFLSPAQQLSAAPSQKHPASNKTARSLLPPAASSKTLPVLNVPTVRTRPPPVVPSTTARPVNAHPRLPIAVTAPPPPQVPAVVSHTLPSSFDDLPEDEPSPDKFKIFNLQPNMKGLPLPPSQTQAPSPSSSLNSVPSVFPPVSASALNAAGFIQGPIVGFPPGMVISPNMLAPHASSFSQPQASQAAMLQAMSLGAQAAVSTLAPLSSSRSSSTDSARFDMAQRQSAAAATTLMLKEKQKQELLMLKQNYYKMQLQSQQQEQLLKQKAAVAARNSSAHAKTVQEQLNKQRVHQIQRERDELRQKLMQHEMALLRRQAAMFPQAYLPPNFSLSGMTQQPWLAQPAASPTSSTSQGPPPQYSATSSNPSAASPMFQRPPMASSVPPRPSSSTNTTTQRPPSVASSSAALPSRSPVPLAATTGASPSAQTSLAPSKNKTMLQRAKPLYVCPYCPTPTHLKALDVASHIQNRHAGKAVVFKKAVGV